MLRSGRDSWSTLTEGKKGRQHGIASDRDEGLKHESANGSSSVEGGPKVSAVDRWSVWSKGESVRTRDPS